MGMPGGGMPPRPGGAPPMGGGMPPKPPMGGGMPGGGLKAQESVFNSGDMLKKSMTGEFRPDMSIKEYLTGVLKVDINGPVTQLIQALKGQAGNATALGKMKNMPPQGMGGMPPKPPMGGGMGAPPAGIESIMSNLK